MGAILGLLTGLGVGAATAAGQEKLQQKHQAELAWHDFMSQSLTSNPELASTPQGQKEIKSIYGEHADFVTNALSTAAAAKKSAQSDFLGMFGPQGGQAPAGGQPSQPGQAPGMMAASTGAAPSAPADPIQQQIDQLNEQVRRGRMHLASAEHNLDPSQVKIAEGMLSDWENQAKTLTNEKFQREQKLTETPYQQAELKNSQERLGIEKAHLSLAQTEAGQRQEDRVYKRKLADARLALGGVVGKGITPEKLAVQRQKFDQQFAQYRSSDPERAVSIDEAWNSYLDNLQKTGTDPKILQPFYSGGATTESTGGLGGLLGGTKAVEKPKFKAGDQQTKDGHTYERDESGTWHLVK